jgi:hypothetical protein
VLITGWAATRGSVIVEVAFTSTRSSVFESVGDMIVVSVP